MATLNGNNVYLSWDGVQIDGYWTGDVSKDESVSTVDITAGSGATHVERASGLLYHMGHMFSITMEKL